MDIQIKKILMRFKHHNRQYVLFNIACNSEISIGNPDYQFLYLIHEFKPLQALFYGTNFNQLINALLKDEITECIECDLGTRIIGGVSLDSGENVDFNLSISNANEILQILDQYLNSKQSVLPISIRNFAE